jgi:hypothetical protein
MPDTRRTLNITRIPESDLFALAHAAVDAGTSRAELVRALLHEAAEKWRAKGRPATGYRYTFHLDAAHSEYLADGLLKEFIRAAELFGVQVAGGMVQVNDDGNQTS